MISFLSMLRLYKPVYGQPVEGLWMICGRSVEAWHKNVPNYTSTGGLRTAARVGRAIDDGGQQFDSPQTASPADRPQRLLSGRHESHNAAFYQTSKPPQCHRKPARIAMQVGQEPICWSGDIEIAADIYTGEKRPLGDPSPEASAMPTRGPSDLVACCCRGA